MDIEVSIQACGVAADLAARLNCPHCQKLDTNDHHGHFCLEPTVVVARRDHQRPLAAAIHTCTQKIHGI